MSGLVSGLQNHVRRFESARYLKKKFGNFTKLFFVINNYLILRRAFIASSLPCLADCFHNSAALLKFFATP